MNSCQRRRRIIALLVSGKCSSYGLTSSTRPTTRLFGSQAAAPFPLRIQIPYNHALATHSREGKKRGSKLPKERERERAVELFLKLRKSKLRRPFRETYTMPQALSSQLTISTIFSISISKESIYMLVGIYQRICIKIQRVGKKMRALEWK